MMGLSVQTPRSNADAFLGPLAHTVLREMEYNN